MAIQKRSSGMAEKPCIFFSPAIALEKCRTGIAVSRDLQKRFFAKHLMGQAHSEPHDAASPLCHFVGVTGDFICWPTAKQHEPFAQKRNGVIISDYKENTK